MAALAVAVAAVVAGLVGWNLIQHAKTPSGRSRAVAEAPRSPAITPVDPGPAKLGAPPPAPPEATTPPAYETPGLAAAVAAKASSAAGHAPAAAPPVPSPAVDPGPIGVPFAPQGVVYGAPGGGAGVILQARSATTLVVRASNGQVIFAKQLSAGEAWRAPDSPGLTAEAGNPSAIEFYLQGLSQGRLTDPKTVLSKLAVAK